MWWHYWHDVVLLHRLARMAFKRVIVHDLWRPVLVSIQHRATGQQGKNVRCSMVRIHVILYCVLVISWNGRRYCWWWRWRLDDVFCLVQ